MTDLTDFYPSNALTERTNIFALPVKAFTHFSMKTTVKSVIGPASTSRER